MFRFCEEADPTRGLFQFFLHKLSKRCQSLRGRGRELCRATKRIRRRGRGAPQILSIPIIAPLIRHERAWSGHTRSRTTDEAKSEIHFLVVLFSFLTYYGNP
jgi:hypothetical protein